MKQLLDHSLGLTKDDVRSTSMGVTGVDIQLSQSAKTAWPYAIECKNQEAVGPIYKMFEQAEANAIDLTSILVIKKNHEKPLVVMDAQTFFERFRVV